MLHDRAEHGGLDFLPVAVGFGDRDEVGAKKHAGHAFKGEKRLCERRLLGPSGLRISSVPSVMTGRPGRNFNVADWAWLQFE